MPNKNVSVLTITQKTDNAMSGWSASVESEREKLLEKVCTIKSQSFVEVNEIYGIENNYYCSWTCSYTPG